METRTYTRFRPHPEFNYFHLIFFKIFSKLEIFFDIFLIKQEMFQAFFLVVVFFKKFGIIYI